MFSKKKEIIIDIYRCRTRKCGYLILLNQSNIQKIINKKENELVEFTKLSKKDHTYQENNIFISNNEIQTYNENIQFAEDLIRKNLEKTEEWHYQNLINNNCKISKSKIKNIL